MLYSLLHLVVCPNVITYQRYIKGHIVDNTFRNG